MEFEKKERITFNIESDLKKDLKQYALDNDSNITELLNEWIKENIK